MPTKPEKTTGSNFIRPRFWLSLLILLLLLILVGMGQWDWVLAVLIGLLLGNGLSGLLENRDR